MLESLLGYNAGDILWLGDWSTAWIASLAALAVGILLLSLYDLRPMTRRRRWTLISLRALAFAIALVMLLEPAVDLKNVTKVKNHVAVLVDSSRSMSLPASDDADLTRFDLALEALESLDLPQNREDEDHKYALFTFGNELRTTTPQALKNQEPGDDRSDLTEALEGVQNAFPRGELGGIVIISDGIDSGGIGTRTRRDEALDTRSIELLESLKAPVNTITTGHSGQLKDLAIKDVKHDDFAFVHNKVAIDVEIQAVGLGTTSVPITLERDGEVLQTREVRVREDSTRYELTFEFVPKQLGREIYTVRAPDFEGEILYENNVAHFIQKVIRDKIRVLQVVGKPSWDQRFLRRLLKRNPNVDLISFFILRTAENPQVARQSELSLIPFPTDELFSTELPSFDLVIFQNFNFGPYQMRQYLPDIADFVQKGGGFAMVGGDLSFASGEYSGTPIEDTLPVGLPSKFGSDLVDTRAFRPELTDAGASHPIMQLAFDPRTNRDIWGSLPEQTGTNLVLEAKSDATVLATHPRLSADRKPMPVIAVSDKGEGRVMAITTDSTWRWGFENLAQGGTPREYQVFWNNAMRWLIKDPELKLLRVELARDRFSPGDDLDASISLRNPDYTPREDGEVEVVITRMPFDSLGDPGTNPEVVDRQTLRTDARGSARIDTPIEKPGAYRVTASFSHESSELRDEDTLIAVESVREFRDPLPRPALLEKIAAATRADGTTAASASRASLKFQEPQTVQVNRRRVIHLWDSAILFAIFLLVLASEWTLRRRWGRL